MVVWVCRSLLDDFCASALGGCTFGVGVGGRGVYRCLGFGAICGRGFDPGVGWVFGCNNGYSLIKFYAIRDIEVDGGLGRSYGVGYWNNKKIKKLI